MRKTFDKFYYFEIMERISMLRDILEDNIREHPAMRNSWKDKIDEAQAALGWVYGSAAGVFDNIEGNEK